MSDLVAFAQLASTEGVLQAQLVATTTPEEIVALARSRGFTFTVAELRDYSRNLGAPHWPWANRSDQARRQFFAQSPPPEERAGGGWPKRWRRP